MSTRGYGFLLSFVTSVALSCSGGDDAADRKKPPKPDTEYKDYAIHVVAKTKKGEVLVEFPPAAALSAPGAPIGPKSSTASTAATNAPGSKPMVVVESDGGTVGVDIEEGAAFLLLMRAVGQCRADNTVLHLTPPWMPHNTAFDSWYVFEQKFFEGAGQAAFDSCEDLLASEEALLCAADLLKGVADAVAPVTWDAIDPELVTFIQAPDGTAAPAYMHDTWVIPPQSTKDKFIVRDLAINVLANLARLDMELPYPWGTLPLGETCANAWVSSAVDDNYFTTHWWQIYGGGPVFDPTTTVIIGNKSELGRARLAHNTQTLRAAGRLLRDLIDDSVMADLAGAERQRARSADPGRGPALYWGGTTDSDAPYNSLAHAFRVVFGRWESPRPTAWGPAPTFGPTEPPLPSGDPACGGFAPMELLTDAMGPGTSARWKDRRVRKPAQQFAVQLIDKAGVVIPKQTADAYWSAGNFGTVIGAVKKQLVLSAAVEVGASSVNDPAFALRRQAIESMVDGVDQADLKFGLDRSFGAYRLLAGAAEDATVPAPDPAGVELVASAELDQDMANVGGNVLKGGMQRSDVATDIMARVGPGQSASQCFEALTPVPWGTANMGKVSAFQDAFMIGDTFRRRLSQTRQLTEAWIDSEFPKLADAGATELRTWTGPAYGFQAEFGGNLYVRLLGIAPEDLGVSTPAEMTGRIVAVWGKPWVADCAAKLRQSCPASFDTNYVRTPTNEWVNENTYQYPLVFGADGRALELEFPLSNGPTNFTPSFTTVGQAPSNTLYLVSRNDPKNPGFGKVLATIALRQYPSGSQPGYFLVSDYQRKLANDIFGVSEKWSVKGPKVGERSSGASPSYCIPGVPHDFFVPLENELTSDSDSFESSWKHYLSLAKQAAAQADELGEKLIEIGLQQDFRREAASEQIGKLCGDFTAVDGLEVKAGELKNTADDSTLNSCIAEPTFEMVFLTSKPPEEVNIKADILNCPTNDNPLCSKDEAYIEGKDVSAGLGITTFEDPVLQGIPEPPACGEVLGVAASLYETAGFEGDQLKNFASKPEFSPGTMASVLKSLKLTVKPSMHWEAKFDGALVMSTEVTDAQYWPSCGTACGSISNEARKKLAENLRDTFGTIDATNDGARDSMLQRVTGALWLMAAISGQLPDGRFTLPIPAFNSSTSDDLAYVPTLYGKGKFTLDAGQVYRLDVGTQDNAGDVTPTDIEIINAANGQVIQPPFYSAVAASPLRPDWVKAIYGDTGHHIHLIASNTARNFPPYPGVATWVGDQGAILQGVRASEGVTGACLADVPNAQKLAKVKADHRKVKYPANGPERICATQDGQSPLVLAEFVNADETAVMRIL